MERDPSTKHEPLIEPESVYIALIGTEGNFVDAFIARDQWQELSFEERILLRIGNAGDDGFDTQNHVIDVLGSEVGATTQIEKELVKDAILRKQKDRTIETLRGDAKASTFRLRLSEAGKVEAIGLLEKCNSSSDDAL